VAKGENTADHPKRKVGREDYHSRTVGEAANWAANNTTYNVDEVNRMKSDPNPSVQRWALQESGDYDRD
jgi:hypothetical protein